MKKGKKQRTFFPANLRKKEGKSSTIDEEKKICLFSVISSMNLFSMNLRALSLVDNSPNVSHIPPLIIK